jgi:ABC-type multidrug transport system ATPase subunit
MIHVRGLRKTYGDGKEALRGVDLDIGEGMTGLLGPNGAGKTTFLSMLVLALQPTGGTRVYDGLDAAAVRNHGRIRAMIGYLPQDFEPIGRLTGFEYLLHCARIRGVRLSSVALRERVRLLMEAVDLQDAAFRHAGTYSGGMMRRLGIAQALIHRPKIVVVDEPTAGLDPEERIRFRNLITEVAETTAVLLSTHIVEDVEATCERVCVIADGRLLFDDTPSALLRQAVGRLWRVEPGAGLPDGAALVARRAERGREIWIVRSDETLSVPVHEDPTLEEAYGSFLSGVGLSPMEAA